LILSLDADVLIDLANGRHPAVRARFDEAISADHRIFTCSLCAHELLFGASISGRPEFQLRTARALLGQIGIAEFSLEDAEASARLRALLRSIGNSIGAVDTLIAGQALARGWVVVTGNLREFGRVPDLQTIDWRTSQTP
jgi:tRNA(fMet)-specific endonuclease VapC